MEPFTLFSNPKVSLNCLAPSLLCTSSFKGLPNALKIHSSSSRCYPILPSIFTKANQKVRKREEAEPHGQALAKRTCISSDILAKDIKYTHQDKIVSLIKVLHRRFADNFLKQMSNFTSKCFVTEWWIIKNHQGIILNAMHWRKLTVNQRWEEARRSRIHEQSINKSTNIFI